MERDYVVTLLSHGSGNFNSHAHVERDQTDSHAKVGLIDISTHTLTWSVTTAVTAAETATTISTHTLTWSVTVALAHSETVPADFNSHAHVERDADVQEARHGKWDFNSHAHVERDKNAYLAWLEIFISTHTLTWSVTLSCFGIGKQWEISTHTLTWSVTCSLYDYGTHLLFQLTRSRGA